MFSAEVSRQGQENNQEDANVTVDIPIIETFLKPPPEVLRMVFEKYINPQQLLESRLVSSDFRHVINQILEKRWLSLWDWSSISGETESCRPIQRKFPCFKIFQHPSEVDSFMETMEQYSATEMSPFPTSGAYFRSVRPLPKYAETNVDGNDVDRLTEMEGCTVTALGADSVTFYTVNYGDNFDESHVVTVAKILQLLERYGKHIKSLIWECGVNTELSLGDITSVLEKTPNISHLLLKDIQVDISGHSLPKLENLTSIKLIGCHNVSKPMLQNYHGQLTTFQLANPLDGWFTTFDWIQKDNEGILLGNLVELKLDGLDKGHGFDSLGNFFRAQIERGNTMDKLERLAIGYKFIPLQKPAETLLSLLQYFPKLKELNVGKYFNSEFSIKLLDELTPLGIQGPFPSLTKLHLPLKFLEFPGLVWRILHKLPSVKEITFVHSDNLFGFQQIPCRPEHYIHLPQNATLRSQLEMVLNGTGHPALVKMSAVSFVNSKIWEMCAIKKTTK